MTAIVVRTKTKLAGLTGVAGVGGRAGDLGRRAIAYAAAAVMAGAVGVALLQLVAEILSFPAPVAVPATTLMAAALLTSLRRHLRAPAGRRPGPGIRIACAGKPARIRPRP